MLPTVNNRKIVKAISAVARAQTLSPGFDYGRAVMLAGRIEDAIQFERTDETTLALCALLLKGMGIAEPRELADLLRA